MFNLESFTADCDKVSSQIADYILYAIENSLTGDSPFVCSISKYTMEIRRKEPEIVLEIWIANGLNHLHIYGNVTMIQIADIDRLRLYNGIIQILERTLGIEAITLEHLVLGRDSIDLSRLRDYLFPVRK